MGFDTSHVAPRVALAISLAILLVAGSLGRSAGQEVGESNDASGSGEVGETESPGAEGEADPGLDQVTMVGRLALPDGVSRSGSNGMVVWAAGRTGYMIVDEQGLAAFDLDSLEEVQRGVVAGVGQGIYELGGDNVQGIVAIDDASGTLYVPIRDDGVPAGSDRATCAQQLLVTIDCLGEVRVVDGRTLEVLATHEFRPINIEGVATLPVLRAMSYAPASNGASAKLHLFVEAQITPGFSDADARTRVNFAYAVQMDAVTGATDWVTRLTGCTDFHQSPSVSGSSGRRNEIFHVADQEKPRLYVGCYRSRGATAVVKLDLDGADPLMAPTGQRTFSGLPKASGYIADPDAERLLVRVNGTSGASYSVFDGQRESFVGNIGVGQYSSGAMTESIDPATGRVYSLAISDDEETTAQGLFLSDGRRDPVAQAIVLRRFAVLFASHRSPTLLNDTPVAVVPEQGELPRRIFVRPGLAGGSGKAPDFYYVLEDRGEVPQQTADAFLVAPPTSDDVPVIEPATAVNFTGTARGYGLRALLIGGLEALASTDPSRLGLVQVGQADPGTNVDNSYGVIPGLLNIIDTFAGIAGEDTGLAETFRQAYPGLGESGITVGVNCLTADREIGFGLAASRSTPSDLSATSSSATAAPAFADAQTLADFANPAERCAGESLEALDDFASLIGLQPPTADEAAIPFASQQASCVSGSDETNDSVGGDQLTGSATAQVRCLGGSLSEGQGRTQLVSVAEISVGDASSTFRIDHGPDDRVVATIYSVARDIDIAGLVHIDEVSAQAVSWASGRSSDTEAASTCDTSRTAGTCFQRTVRGVTAGDFSCDVCPDNEQWVAAMSAALGGQWQVRLREPDPQLALGSSNGALAAIQKPFDQLFADSILNSDGLFTVPALEVIRINDDQQGRARQVYQFAGVELASVFSIQCQLQIIDGECKREPGALTIALQDLDQVPLPGGVFELYADADAGGGSGDGIIDPLTDVLIDQGTCATAADGIGTCRFEQLEPGDYVIREAGAPVGYMAADDFAVTVGEGDDLTVTFTNASSIGAIDLNLADELGVLLSGGTFQLYIDDGDGVLTQPSLVGPSAGADQFVASCVTDFLGECGFDLVPLGPTGERSFIVHESSPPEGYAPSPDATLTLRSGELFTLNFVNIKDLGGRILVSLVDDVTGDPLVGGAFDVFVDDGNQAVDDTDVLYASCTTDASGRCFFAGLAVGAESVDGPLRVEDAGGALSVPIDAYVVQQSGAPEGYRAADAVGFAFTERGQQADVVFRNGLDVPEVEPTVEPTEMVTATPTPTATAGPGDGSSTGVDESASATGNDGDGGSTEETVSDSGPVTTGVFTPFPTISGPIAFDIPVPLPVVARTAVPQASAPQLVQFLQAPGRLARLVVREPLQAAAFAALILLGAGSAAVARRRLLLVELLG